MLSGEVGIACELLTLLILPPTLPAMLLSVAILVANLLLSSALTVEFLVMVVSCSSWPCLGYIGYQSDFSSALAPTYVLLSLTVLLLLMFAMFLKL
jgi:hypothetical protein